jgi:P-aminobenzoate N-oxygenase AurF
MSAAVCASSPAIDLAAVMTRQQPIHVPQPRTQSHVDTTRYAKCIEVSKRVRWDIDRDVIRHREFDFTKKFLPDSLSFVDRVSFLGADERRVLSQIQGRSYANIFGLIERYISAKILELSRDYSLGDQTALEALVRFTDEELKHQELFRRIETLIGAGMPPGYALVPRPNEVAAVVLSKSTWSVLALTCLIELFTQAHYQASIEPDSELSPLFKDVFLFHWKEESQHAIMDELEWARENAKLTPAARDAAVDDLIALVGAVDEILQVQSAADTHYFVEIRGRTMTTTEVETVKATVLAAYRWQYILSGVELPRFSALLTGMITPAQGKRIGAALAPIMTLRACEGKQGVPEPRRTCTRLQNC